MSLGEFTLSTRESSNKTRYLGELPVANLKEAVAKDDDVEDNVSYATPETVKEDNLKFGPKSEPRLRT